MGPAPAPHGRPVQGGEKTGGLGSGSGSNSCNFEVRWFAERQVPGSVAAGEHERGGDHAGGVSSGVGRVGEDHRAPPSRSQQGTEGRGRARRVTARRWGDGHD
jgi:hypothetical protein